MTGIYFSRRMSKIINGLVSMRTIRSIGNSPSFMSVSTESKQIDQEVTCESGNGKAMVVQARRAVRRL